MSERKVLNKYYPPDFDPTKLPKLKRGKDRQFVIRIMAPFSMRCTTCGEYIYKGRKFNSRMETVQNENYLGLRIYRFYIRCTKCISEITFKTDPKSSDYIMEKGATRNFESLRRLQEKIERESKEVEQEEAANPMKALETRTRDSKREMESIEKLEELRDLNTRAAAIDPEKLIEDHLRVGQRMVEDEIKRQEQEDEDMIKNIFGKSGTGGDGYLRRIIDDGSSDDDDASTSYQSSPSSAGDKRKATDLLLDRDDVAGSSSSYTTSSSSLSMGPTPDPSNKKAKLKTPFDDLASMVKVSKNKNKEKLAEEQAKAEKERLEAEKRKKEEEEELERKQKDIVKEPEALPAYKINLKKQTDNSNAKMKGASLSLLGGYGSMSGSDDSEED